MRKDGNILIVDDNRSILTTAKILLEDGFANTYTLANPNGIPAALRDRKPDVVLLDMNFGSGVNNGNEGLFWLREIKRLRPQTQVVLCTAYADIELAVSGIKEGAADFIVKPWDNEKMIETVAEAYRKTTRNGGQGNRADNAIGDGGMKAPGNDTGKTMLWGESEEMQRLRIVVEKVAATDANILITGENGTGKEMLANEIHRLSARHSGPMTAIDMGAITETLFESELFGHQRGAFTDAHADKPGKFELAEGGTLFLDEIGNLSYGLQAKLLTALQRRSIVRIGGTAEIPVNVRLLCATNRNLEEMVKKGLFREDLLYRINTIHLHLPSLRERRTDIVPLAEMFLDKYAAKYNKHGMVLDGEAKEKITAQQWAGNIRELEHTMEKTVILSEGNIIRADCIECAPQQSPAASPSESMTLEEMEKSMIRKAIDECEGNMSAVANKLGISRQTLYNKIKRYGL